MNRYKKELLKKYTPQEIQELHDKNLSEQAEDVANFRELYSFCYDSSWDISDRKKGISPLSKEARDYIRTRYERGDYPERLHYLVMMELQLKHPDE